MIDDPEDRPYDEDEESEVWDEFQWEEFFKRSDEKADKYGRLIEKYGEDLDAEKLIAKEMGWDWVVEALEAEERGELPEEDDGEDWNDGDEEGEEWKAAAGIERDLHIEGDYPPVHEKARGFALAAIDFVKQLGENYPREECIQKFIEGATVPGAKIAGSTAFAHDIKMLGGAIANCKRGLDAANRCLEALQKMKEKKIMDDGTYLRFVEQAKTVRDELAIHIAELRDRFQKGIP